MYLDRKISVAVIAHNEEENISDCIESILTQSIKPDEIVVVAHNCKDRTEKIVSMFKDERIKLFSYHGETGTGPARMKAFGKVSNELVACIDGDAIASKNWLKHILLPLIKKSSINVVSGVAVFKGFYWFFSSINFFFIKTVFCKRKYNYFWGPNFAVKKSAYEKVGGLAPLFEIKKKLGLKQWLEDYYLSIKLQEIGGIVFARKSVVWVKPKEQNSLEARKRVKDSLSEIERLRQYLSQNNGI